MSTVNGKMTAIANGIRTLSGETSSLTLDDMATELNSMSATLHEVNLELTNLVDLMIDSGIGETLNGTNPDFPVVEQIQDLAGDLSSNLDPIFHFFNTNTTTIKNDTSYPALVYFNAPADFSFTSITIPPNSTRGMHLIQTCVCFIVLHSSTKSISFRGSDNIELITNEVFTNSLHRYMIFRGVNTIPKIEATITITQSDGPEEPS